MQQSLAFLVVRNRTVLVALANAGATWVVLIIAPLGLLAVITCTLLVFVCSLGFGYICDRAFRMLSREEREALAGETFTSAAGAAGRRRQKSGDLLDR
jgi:F0F1-type ATP synthase membrane subunit c/vacuolar-type H+-ATPase subunit K